MIIAVNLALRIAASVLCVPPESISLNGVLPMMAPLPTSPAQMKHREAIDDAIRTGWREDDGFNTPDEQEDYVDAVGRKLNDGLLLRDQSAADILGVLGVAGVAEEGGGGGADADAGGQTDVTSGGTRPSTYGEITTLGARQLFHCMAMTGSTATERDDEDVVFFDLGSGAGRLTVQCYLELPRIAKAVGIELAPARHGAAVRAWDGLVASGVAERVRGMGLGAGVDADTGKAEVNRGSHPTLELHQGDLFGLDISDATHIYASSLCFTDGMMAKLAAKLDGEAPRLQTVATLKQFPPGSLFGITSPYSEFVEMSWTKNRGEGCSVYFYKRKLS